MNTIINHKESVSVWGEVMKIKQKTYVYTHWKVTRIKAQIQKQLIQTVILYLIKSTLQWNEMKPNTIKKGMSPSWEIDNYQGGSRQLSPNNNNRHYPTPNLDLERESTCFSKQRPLLAAHTHS